MWERLVQPLQRVNLNTINPQFPVEMRAGNAPGPADQADDLTLLDDVAHLNLDLGLVPDATVYTPAVVNDGGIASHRQRPGEDDASRRRGSDAKASPAAEIQAGVEAVDFQVGAGAYVGAPVPEAGGEIG